MMYRNVMEQLDTDRLRYDRYVFVGFNVLNRVETRFFQALAGCRKSNVLLGLRRVLHPSSP